MTSSKEPVQRVLDATAPVNYKYQHDSHFRTDLIESLQGIQDALERISDHLQEN